MKHAKMRVGMVCWLLVTLLIINFSSQPIQPAQAAESFADPAFQQIWNRIDGPVAAGAVKRAYTWGEGGPIATKTERYDSAKSGSRLVQYFAKGRMELGIDANGAPVVTYGRLAFDLTLGILTVGENQVQIYESPRTPIVGDTARTANPNPPSYRDFRDEIGYGARSRVGSEITTTIRAGGRTGTRSSSAQPKVRNAYFEPRTAHNIAEPFWNYFAATGTVYGANNNSVTATLFNWQDVVGYPITEGYWTTYRQGGQDIEALIQLFERRVMVYVPTADEGFQVFSNDVGQHYYNWAYNPWPGYGNQDLTVPAATNGNVEPKFGNESTYFRLAVKGFLPSENITYKAIWPNGTVYQERYFRGKANPQGNFGGFFEGGSFSSLADDPTGVYSLIFTGETSKNVSTVYFRLINIPDATPTKPYTVPQEAVPPSINAIVDPNSGGQGTEYLALLKNFHLKDFTRQGGGVSIWVTDPDGIVYSRFALSDDGPYDEAPEGLIYLLGAAPTPGVWGVTFQSLRDPKLTSIVYIRVTDEPVELVTSLAYNVIRRGTAGKGTGVFADLPRLEGRPKPAPAPVVEPQD